MIDIDSMTSNEWLNYREGLLEDFYAKGFVLKPNKHCFACDIENEYTCFECECSQINQMETV